jgi:hypothetical protein
MQTWCSKLGLMLDLNYAGFGFVNLVLCWNWIANMWMTRDTDGGE